MIASLRLGSILFSLSCFFSLAIYSLVVVIGFGFDCCWICVVWVIAVFLHFLLLIGCFLDAWIISILFVVNSFSYLSAGSRYWLVVLGSFGSRSFLRLLLYSSLMPTRGSIAMSSRPSKRSHVDPSLPVAPDEAKLGYFAALSDGLFSTISRPSAGSFEIGCIFSGLSTTQIGQFSNALSNVKDREHSTVSALSGVLAGLPVLSTSLVGATVAYGNTRSNVERIVSSIDDRIDARLQSSRDSIFELIAAQNAHLSVFTAAITRQLDGMQLSLGRVAAPAVVVDSATADIVMGNVV